MHRGIWIAILALAVLLPGTGRAAEATLAVEGSAQYDSNVFATSTRLVDDVSFRPAVEVGLKADPTSDFQWSLMYRPTYEQYATTHGVSGFDHLARVGLDYHLSTATDVYLKEQFQHVLSLVERAETAQANVTQGENQGGLGQPALIFGRQAVSLNDLQAGITHNFTPRLQGSINLSNSLYYPQANNVSDAITSGASGDLVYALTHQDRIGSSLAFTYQQLSSTDFQPRTSTRYYQFMGIWIHDFSPTLQLDLRAGPVWVDPSSLNVGSQRTVQNMFTTPLGGERFAIDATSCPTQGGNIIVTSECTRVTPTPLDDAQVAFSKGTFTTTLTPGETGGSNGGLTYFAAITLAKHWERWDASLTYQRTTGASSSFNQSTILDTVQGGLRWQPSELWNARLSASWSRRTSASDLASPVAIAIPASDSTDPNLPAGLDPNAAVNTGVTTVKFHNAVDVDTWIAYLRLDRRLSRRFSVFGLLMFINQNDSSQFSSSSDFTDYRAQLGFRYEFEPLPLAM